MNSIQKSVELPTAIQDSPVVNIKVIGIGNGGMNAIKHMQTHHIEGVELICSNTDAQALSKVNGCIQLQLGESITRGLGAGANPEVGRQAAESDKERIRTLLEGTDIVFLAVGESGGTGSGAAPVFAEIAHQLGILTIAVVTKPFIFEGNTRLLVAEKGINQLSPFVDSLIIISNNKLMKVLGKQVSLLEAFKAVNNVLLNSVQGISELITRPGLINVDFADVKAVMSEMGVSIVGMGEASGEDRAQAAAQAALTNPLLEDIPIADAQGVLVNVTAGFDLSIGEFEEIGEVVKGFTAKEATVVIGTVIDPEIEGSLRVTVVLTGLGKNTDSLEEAPTFSLETHGEQLFDQPAILRKKQANLHSIHKIPTEKRYLDVLEFIEKSDNQSKKN